MTTSVPPAVDGLVHQLRLLMPEVRISWDRTAGDAPYRASLTLVPSTRRPSLLVPTGRRLAAARAVAARASAADGPRTRTARTVLALALAAGGARLARGHLRLSGDHAPDVLSRLAAEAGVAAGAATFSVAVGAARANAKPVVAVHDPRGRVRLWAKFATTPLTAGLVRGEFDTLERLGRLRLRTLSVPRSRGLLVTPTGPALLMEPVRGRARAPRGVATVLVEAMAELAVAEGTRTQTAQGWVADRFGTAAPIDIDGLWGARHVGILTLGSWHGDWGPWNMSWRRRLPQVWDWERFEGDVPVGVDAVHFGAHATLRRLDVERSTRRLARVSDEMVEPTLRAAGVPAAPADVAAVVDAYLLLVHHRFATEAAEDPTGLVHRVADHYLVVLRERLSSTHPPRGRATSGSVARPPDRAGPR